MTKVEFLNILSIHKEKLKLEYEKPGWNIWVLYGALASLSWIIIDLYSKDDLEWRDSILLLIAFIIIEPIAILIFTGLKGKKQKKSSAYRKINQEIKHGIPIILFNLAIYFSIFICLNFNSKYSFVSTTSLNVLIILMIILYLMPLVLSLFNFHFKKNASQSNKIAKNSIWFFGLIYLFLITMSIRELILELEDFHSVKMIKSSLIFIGVYFVISKIISYSQENLMLNSIDHLIDDITLDNVLIEDGFNQLKIIINGIEFSEIMAPSLHKYIELNKDYQKEIESTMHRLEKFSCDLSIPDQEMIKDAMQKSLERIQIIEEEISIIRNKFNRKIAYFYSYEHDSQEYKELHEQFNEMDVRRNFQLNKLKGELTEIGGESGELK